MAKKSKKQRSKEAARLQRQVERLAKAQEKVLAKKFKPSKTRKVQQDLTFDLKVDLPTAMKKHNVREAKVGDSPYQVQLWVKSGKSARRTPVFTQTDVVVNLTKKQYQRYQKILKQAKDANMDIPVITPDFFDDVDKHLDVLEAQVSPENQSRLNSLATFNFLTSVVSAYPPELQYAIARAMEERPDIFTNENIGKSIRSHGRDVLDQVFGSDNPESDTETVNAVLSVFPVLQEYYDEAVTDGYTATDFTEKNRFLNKRALRIFED